MFKSSKIFLISISLTSAVFLAVLVFIIYNIRVKNREASELINTADRIAEATVLSESVETIRADAASDISMLENLTLSGDRLVFLIENIEAVGRALNLDVTISSVERIEDKKSVEPSVFRMMLNIEGSWPSAFAFLRAVENLPYRVMMDEISLSRDEVGWQGKIILSIHTFD